MRDLDLDATLAEHLDELQGLVAAGEHDSFGRVADDDLVVVDLDLHVAVVVTDVREPHQRLGVGRRDRHRVALQAGGRQAVEEILEPDDEVSDRGSEAHRGPIQSRPDSPY